MTISDRDAQSPAATPKAISVFSFKGAGVRISIDLRHSLISTRLL